MSFFFFGSVNAEEDKKDSVLKCSFADLSDFCLGELISNIPFIFFPSLKISCLLQTGNIIFFKFMFGSQYMLGEYNILRLNY